MGPLLYDAKSVKVEVDIEVEDIVVLGIEVDCEYRFIDGESV